MSDTSSTDSARKLWEVLVPTVRNCGKPFRTRHHRVWDERVRRVAGGLTIFKPARGQWVAPSGELFNERMIPVRIACTEAELTRIVEITLKHYDQHAVMVYKVSDDVRIVHRDG